MTLTLITNWNIIRVGKVVSTSSYLPEGFLATQFDFSPILSDFDGFA